MVGLTFGFLAIFCVGWTVVQPNKYTLGAILDQNSFLKTKNTIIPLGTNLESWAFESL